MATQIKFNTNAVEARIMNKWNQILPQLTEEILNDCNQYCKFDTGMLIQSSEHLTDFKRGIMIWGTPYAKRQYWKIRTAYTDMNPNATWKWVHFAKGRHQSEWVRKAELLMGVGA